MVIRDPGFDNFWIYDSGKPLDYGGGFNAAPITVYAFPDGAGGKVGRGDLHDFRNNRGAFTVGLCRFIGFCGFLVFLF